MKKIKSVKLKNDFRRAFVFFPKGTKLDADFINKTYVISKGLECFTEYEIRNCTTDLFEVEYEPERKSIIVKVEYDSKNGNTDFTAQNISYILNLYSDLNHKVTEVRK